MPEDFVRAFQRGLNFDSGDDSKKRLDALLKFLKTEVESEERINLAMTCFDLTDATSYKRGSNLKKDKIFISASLLTSLVGAEKLCVFCSRKHEPTNCFKAQKMSYYEKLKVLKDKEKKWYLRFKISTFTPATFVAALFGGERIKEKVHNVLKIELGSLDESFNCNFDIVDQDIICNDVPSVSYGPWIEELRSMIIQMFDIENNSGPIDILVGADVAGRLFTGKRSSIEWISSQGNISRMDSYGEN
ncbi:integrase catalytic domain-containing protein [Trichonephila clavipes]|nr:integrase catalytic domain-containing protein [Trichonephila clavipes]